MFGIGGRIIRPEMKLEDLPSFQPVRSPGHAGGSALLIAGVLLLATLCTGASLSLVGAATADAMPGGARSVAPTVLQKGCDGAWGNEPLDCLLQAA